MLQIVGLNVLDSASCTHLVLHADKRLISQAEVAVNDVQDLFEFFQFLFDENDAGNERAAFNEFLNECVLRFFEK